MKRALFIFFIIFVCMQFFQISKDEAQADKSLEINAPQNIMAIFKTSCYDCHSNEVKYPWYSNIAPFSWAIASHVENGKNALNFSVWQSYSEEKKAEKLKRMYQTIYASMPLQSYLWLHENASLTKEQREEIRKWTGVRK